MEIVTLKRNRKIVSGTLVLLGLLPLYTYWTGTPLSKLNLSHLATAGLTIVLAYGIGALYDVFCLNRKSHTKNNDNIKLRLLSIGRTTPISPQKREELLAGSALMATFYNLVDSNDSLKEKAQRVRDNGLVWTSVADVVVVGVASICLNFPLWLFTRYANFLYWAAASAVLAIISALIVHPRVVRRHISLSNDQLDFIDTQMKREAQTKVNAL